MRGFLLATAALASVMTMSVVALAVPYVFSYGGRLANSADVAVTGPVNLEVKFYRLSSGGNPVPVSPMTFNGVALDDGVFQVDLTQLSGAELALVLDPSLDTYIEVTDHTNNVTYPRQHLSAMPYAMKVPVDGKTLVFGEDGNLTLATTASPGANQFLTKDSSGNLIWGSPAASASAIQGQTISSVAPSAGQVLKYDGTQWSPQAATGGTVANVSASLPLVVTAGSTTPSISLTPVTSMSNGYLTSADWLTFQGMLPKTGGTMTGVLNMGASALTNLATPSATTDATTKAYVDTANALALRKDGSVPLTAAWAVGSQNLTGVGNLSLSPQKTFGLGTYDNTTEPAMTTTLTTADKGKTWFNSATNQIKFWDGSTAQALGTSGSGLTNLNGQSANTQTFATGTSGAAPTISSASGVHTFNFPLAATASVTAGLLSNTDYTSFAAKQAAGNYLSALSGDVLASGPGAVTATLASTGVSAGSYTKVTVDSKGRVTAGATLSVADIPSLAASIITSGALGVSVGGNGTTATPTNGQLHIGNGTGFALAALSSGTGIVVTNGSGAITIAATADAATKLSKSGDTMTGTLVLPTNGLAIGTSQLVVGSGGIGIGTTAPTVPLDIASTSATIKLTSLPANPAGITLNAGTGSYGQITNSAGPLNLVNTASTNGDISLQTSGPNSTYITTNGTERMRVTYLGNVGIGTLAPAAMLHVAGAMAILGAGDGATPSASTLRGAAAAGTDIAGAPFSLMPANGTGTGGSGALLLQTAAAGTSGSTPDAMTPRLVITPSGNIGIGSLTPAHTLEVVGTAANTSGGSWLTLSDRRLKDVLGDYEYGLAEIKQLHTVRFKYKAGNALSLPSAPEHTGFIAQEVRSIIPDAVLQRPDGYLELNVDPIHWATVNAVRELAVANEQLLARLDQAEAATAELKSRVTQAEADNKLYKAFICAQFAAAAFCP